MSETALAPSPRAAEHHMPHSEFHKDGKLKIVIAGLDKNVRQQAVEAANRRLNAETHEGGFKGFIRGSIWKGNIAREYYLAKYQREAEGQIRENNNLLHHEDRSDEAARVATTLRYASEYENEVIHEGETRKNIESDTSEEAVEVKDAVKGLIRRYASGELDDDSFEEEKRRVMTELAEDGASQNYIGEGLLYADNMLQIAQNVKAAIDHGQSMDELLDNAELIVGEARLGARTEARLSGTERIMKKLEGKAFVHEATVATAVSIAYSVGGWAPKRAISTVGKLAVPGIGAGVIAAARENRILKEERAMHMREMAEGKQFEAETDGNARREQPGQSRYGAKSAKGLAKDLIDQLGLFDDGEGDSRREQLEQSRYETKSAKDLTDQLGLLYDDEGNLRIEGDKARFDEAMAIVSEVQARTRLSDREKLDLISFSGVDNVETERLNLDLALAKAKVDLRNLIRNADDMTLVALGIQPADIRDLQAKDLDELALVLDPRVEATEGVLGGEITVQDRVFNKLRAKRVASAFAKGTVLGVAFGLGVHEADALASHAVSAVGKAASYTVGVAGKVLPFSHPEISTVGVEATEFGPPVELSDGAKLTMPAEFHAQVADGKLNVMGSDGASLNDLQLNRDGTLSPAAIQELKSNGFRVTSMHETVSQVVNAKETVSAREFAGNHSDMTAHVTRDFWYDNGTPRVAEGRELDLDLRYDSKGNIVFDISRMNLSQDELKHLEMALSASSGTQHEPFMVNFDSHGRAVIEKGDTRFAMFSKGADGPVFEGKYAEAVEVAGKDEHGVTHIRPLATIVGEGNKSFTDTVSHIENHPATSYVIDHSSSVSGTTTYVPPVVPIYGRRGLGKTTKSAPRQTPTAEENLPSGTTTPSEALGLGASQAAAEDNANNPNRRSIFGLPSLPEPSPENNQIENTTQENNPTGDTNQSGGGQSVPGIGAAETATPIPLAGGAENQQAPNGTASAEAGNQAPNSAERQFFKDLDAEQLDTPAGYDFAGYRNLGQRERKQAVRFIRQAMDEIGGDDKVAVVARAQELAQAAQGSATGELAALYGRSIHVLELSAVRVAGSVESKHSGGAKYLNDLDKEQGLFPFRYTLGTSYISPAAQKLVTRIYRDVYASVSAEFGNTPNSKDDPVGYNRWIGKLFRQAQRIAHPDQYSDLSKEQRAIFEEAQKAFGQAKVIYRARAGKTF